MFYFIRMTQISKTTIIVRSNKSWQPFGVVFPETHWYQWSKPPIFFSFYHQNFHQTGKQNLVVSSCTGTQRNKTLTNCVTTPCMDMKTIGIPPCTGTPGQPPKLSVWVIKYVTHEKKKKNLCCYMYPGFTLELPRIILTCATPDNKFLYLVKLLPLNCWKLKKWHSTKYNSSSTLWLHEALWYKKRIRLFMWVMEELIIIWINWVNV